MTDTSRLLLPKHADPDDGRDCAASSIPGYWQDLVDGQVHCNRCGWIGDKPLAPRSVMFGYGTDPEGRLMTKDLSQLSGYSGGSEKLKAARRQNMISVPSGREALRELADRVQSGDHFAPMKEWAAMSISLLDELERTEARLDECRKAREAGY